MLCRKVCYGVEGGRRSCFRERERTFKQGHRTQRAFHAENRKCRKGPESGGLLVCGRHMEEAAVIEVE